MHILFEKKKYYSKWLIDEANQPKVIVGANEEYCYKKVAKIDNFYVVNSDVDSGLDHDKVLLLLAEIIPKRSTKQLVIAWHQGLVGDPPNLSEKILNAWQHAQIYHYSLHTDGKGAVASVGTTLETGKPEVEGKAIGEIVADEMLYPLLPNLFPAAALITQVKEQEDTIANLQLCIQALGILLQTSQHVDDAACRLADSLAAFFSGIAPTGMEDSAKSGLGIDELEQKFKQFQEGIGSTILDPAVIKETITACRKVIDRMDNASEHREEA